MTTPDVDYTKYLDFPYVQIRVELGLYQGDVVWFVVQLEYNFEPDYIQPDDWRMVARFDHHPQMSWGHDIRREGLHMDVYRNGAKEDVTRSFPNVPINDAPAYCERFLAAEHDRFIDQFERWHGLTGNRYSLP